MLPSLSTITVLPAQSAGTIITMPFLLFLFSTILITLFCSLHIHVLHVMRPFELCNMLIYITNCSTLPMFILICFLTIAWLLMQPLCVFIRSLEAIKKMLHQLEKPIKNVSLKCCRIHKSGSIAPLLPIGLLC